MGSRAGSQGLIELGERIRQRRQEKNISQEIFAEKAGVSVNTVSRIEGGQTATSIEILAHPCPVFPPGASPVSVVFLPAVLHPSLQLSGFPRYP